MFAPRPVWGLVFITDSTLYIEPGSSSSWLQRVITSRPTPQAQERIAIPIDSMTKVDIPPPKTGLRRILAAPETEIEIHHEGSPGVLCIVLDWRGANDKLLIEILAELAPGS